MFYKKNEYHNGNNLSHDIACKLYNIFFQYIKL